MTATPMQVLTRPFSVEPITNIMMPDGIFDNAIYEQLITCHFTNITATPLANVRLWIESVGDPGIVPVARTWTFPVIYPGASVRVSWLANFQFATPGKTLVSFLARADGHESRRSIHQIFVSQTRYDATTKTYTCTVGEGKLALTGIKVIGPSNEGWWKCNPKDPRCPPDALGPWVPTGVTMVWTPDPPYAGVHGELPFSDPWWKLVGLIVFIVAAIVGIIAAALGSGKFEVSVGGKFEETEPSTKCCTPEPSKSLQKPALTVAGVASSIAGVGLAAALADTADPFWRGQEATPPADGELTIAERVEASWSFPAPPNAGQAYVADVKWTYERFTTGNTYSHSVSETQTNVHTAGEVTVETPDKVQAFDPLWVKARFAKTDGSLFSGTELYTFALFRSPGGLFFVVDLADDGLGFDGAPNDGTYAGHLDFERAYRLLLSENETPYGVWRVFVFAQDVNLTKPGTPPEIAAQTIGGFFVASAIEITFDPTLPCPLKAQAAITVV